MIARALKIQNKLKIILDKMDKIAYLNGKTAYFNSVKKGNLKGNYSMRSITIIANIMILFSMAIGQTPDRSGRYFPDGSWQPRNMHATLPDPSPGMPAQASEPDNRNQILSIDWGPEVRLTYGLNTFFSAVAADEGYVHAITSNYTVEPYYVRSSDNGANWSDQVCLVDPGVRGGGFNFCRLQFYYCSI